LILAVVPGHVFWAQRVRPDELFTLFYVINLFIVVRIYKDIGTPWINLIAGGLALGFTIATRIPAAAIVLTYATVYFIANKERSPQLNPYLLTGRHLLGILAISLIGYSIASPHTYMYFKQFLSGLKVLWNYESNEVIGHGPGWFRYGVTMLSQSLGYPFYAFFLLGLSWSFWKRSKTDYILLSLFLPYFFMLTNVSWIVVRYTVPLLPICALLIARSLHEISTQKDRWQPFIIGAVTIALAWTLAADTAYSKAIKNYDIRDSAAVWIGDNIHTGAKIAAFIAYEGDFFANPPPIPAKKQRWFNISLGQRDFDLILDSLKQGYFDYIIITEDYLKDERKRGDKLPPSPSKELFLWSEEHPGYTLLRQFRREVSFFGIDFRSQFSAADYVIAYPTIHLFQKKSL